jgi:hypothetical protein
MLENQCLKCHLNVEKPIVLTWTNFHGTPIKCRLTDITSTPNQH